MRCPLARDKQKVDLVTAYPDKFLGAYSASVINVLVEKNFRTTLLFLLKFRGNRECIPNHQICFDKIQFTSV